MKNTSHRNGHGNLLRKGGKNINSEAYCTFFFKVLDQLWSVSSTASDKPSNVIDIYETILRFRAGPVQEPGEVLMDCGGSPPFSRDAQCH